MGEVFQIPPCFVSEYLQKSCDYLIKIMYTRLYSTSRLTLNANYVVPFVCFSCFLLFFYNESNSETTSTKICLKK